MSDDFNLKTLIALVRAARAFAVRGDNLPEPITEEHRQIISAAIKAWIDRVVAHTAPQDDAPDLSIRDLLSMARACDALVVRGDGHPMPPSAELVSVTHAASQVLLSRVAKHPNGDLVAEGATAHPISTQARAIARKARDHLASRLSRTEEAPSPPPAPEVLEPASFPAAPIPASDPPPPATINGDAFVFGPPPTRSTVVPELGPLDLGPTQPAPAAQPEAGQPQAQ